MKDDFWRVTLDDGFYMDIDCRGKTDEQIVEEMKVKLLEHYKQGEC